MSVKELRKTWDDGCNLFKNLKRIDKAVDEIKANGDKSKPNGNIPDVESEIVMPMEE
jgi:hypothetical protein